MSGDASVGLPGVELERLIPAPPHVVFQAWSDAALLARWMTPSGLAEVEVEARVGGRLQVAMVDRGIRIEHTGEFLEFEPPHRLRFTWSSPFTGGIPSVVTVTLAPARGGTRLRLVHTGLPDDIARAHAGGWTSMLDRLVGLATPTESDRTGPTA